MKQDATLHQLILAPGTEQVFEVESERKVYFHQVKGTLAIQFDNDRNSETGPFALNPGDGAMIESQQYLIFNNSGTEPVTALVFDLP